MTQELEQAELRKLVLDFARAQARKAVEQVTESDLDFGRITDRIDVSGIEWHICARYWQDDDLLKIEGHPHQTRDESDGLPAPLAAMFGLGDQPADGSFDFTLPRVWLPA